MMYVFSVKVKSYYNVGYYRSLLYIGFLYLLCQRH